MTPGSELLVLVGKTGNIRANESEIKKTKMRRAVPSPQSRYIVITETRLRVFTPLGLTVSQANAVVFYN